MSGIYARMPEVVPEGAQGVAKVQHFDVERSFFAARDGITPGRYARLLINGQLYMSDTNMERDTNYEVWRRANGHVLIAGLGLGMILTGILDKPEVTAVSVVEKYRDVIDLVAPHHQHHKLTIACADIFEWKPPVGTLFDVVYFDIWPDICLDNLPQMVTLHRRFGRWMNRDNPRMWMGSWERGRLESIRRREKKRGWQ